MDGIDGYDGSCKGRWLLGHRQAAADVVAKRLGQTSDKADQVSK